MSDKNKNPKKKQVKAKSSPMASQANDIAKAVQTPAVDTGALDDAPMLDEPAKGKSAPLGTLSAAESDHSMSASEPTKAHASEPTGTHAPASAPKGSSHKKAKSAKQDDAAPQKKTPQQDDAAPQEKPAQPSVLTAEPPREEPDPFRLPRSAFVGLRKSGGLNFTTREVVFYPDGRVAYDARGVPQKEYTRLRRVMNDGQIVSLRKLLDQTNFWMTEGGGQQNPDAFAYEIAASLNHRSHSIEVFDGSLPENLKPLLERLSKYLPE